MSNLFEEVLNDPGGVEKRLLGPTYPYYENIKTPSQIGMSTKGSLSALGKNIDGLIDYVEVLVTGKSKASATGGPLGNKFFLKTGAKCKDPSGNKVDRYIYVDNVPDGSIPFISSGMGVNFSDFEGLVPGAMGNLSVLNPFTIMQSFLSGSTPDCQELTMQTIDNNNNKSSETHYVTTIDIKAMSPCIFTDNKNPVTGFSCREMFQSNIDLQPENIDLPPDPVTQIYFGGLTIIAVFIFIKLMERANKQNLNI
jgi:hypothetical protein